MKKLYIKLTLAVLILAGLSLQGFAQKDTTELEGGKKKLIIIDKKTQKENAIYNLEKGKETFEKEIIIVDGEIEEHEDLIKEIEMQIEMTFKELEGDSIISKNIKIEYKTDGDTNKNEEVEVIILGEGGENLEEILKQSGIDIKTLEELTELLEQHKETIDINIKKKYAFESGIEEIEKGIEEIEEGLEEIDIEIDEIDGHKKSKKKRFNAHWAGLEFGLLNFLNSSQALVNDVDVDFMAVIPEKTFSYGLNLFEKNIPITKHSLGIATGAGIQWNSLNLEQDINLYEGEGGVMMAELINTELIDMKKNKLNVAYIKVPVVLEYQIPVKNRKLYVNAGFFGSIRAWSKQKQVYSIDGTKYKDKKVDDFQLSGFRYGLSAGAGYGDVGLFVEYSMVPLFKDGSGPEMYPIMVGVRLVDF